MSTEKSSVKTETEISVYRQANINYFHFHWVFYFCKLLKKNDNARKYNKLYFENIKTNFKDVNKFLKEFVYVSINSVN